MKNIFKYTFLGLALMFLASCEDEDTQRIPETEKVVSMRMVVKTAFIDALDVPNATLDVDLYTEVSTISTVELFVDYYSFSQDSTYNTALVRTFNGAEFVGGAIENVSITSQTISDAVGIALADMSGGDQLDFTIFTTLNDGRVFPDSTGVGDALNTTPNILNATNTTSLTTSFTRYIACPVPDGYMLGDYSWEQVSGPVDPFFGTGPIIAEGTVTVSQTSPIGREITDLTYATFGGGTVSFLLVCNNILTPYNPAPASCGGGLGWVGDGSNLFVYDDGDDSEILLNLLHNPTGDCGLTVNDPLVIRLTKL